MYTLAGEFVELPIGPANALLDAVSAKMPRQTTYYARPAYDLASAVNSILSSIMTDLNKIERVFAEDPQQMISGFAHYNNVKRLQTSLGGYGLTMTAIKAKAAAAKGKTVDLPGFKDTVQKALIAADGAAVAVDIMKKDRILSVELKLINIADSIRSFVSAGVKAVGDLTKVVAALPGLIDKAQETADNLDTYIKLGALASAALAVVYLLKKDKRRRA